MTEEREHLFHAEISMEDGRMMVISTPRLNSDALDAFLHVMQSTNRERAIVVPYNINIGYQPIWNRKKEHILDINYPHVCHRCGKRLFWMELYRANSIFTPVGDFKTYKRLKKLWKSKIVEFYCCFCYKSVDPIFFP